MARAPSAKADPAGDAALLLRRLGFAILMFALPASALVFRRALVVLAPLAIILFVIAAFVDGSARGAGRAARRAFFSTGGLAAALVLGWSALSLIWTPFPALALERLFGLLGTVGLGVVGYLALPDRVRSANLYILPLGVGLAALVAAVLALVQVQGGLDDGADQDFERGLVVMALLVWPALAWLRSRERELEALLLAAAVTLAAVLAPFPMPLVGLVVGAFVFALTAAKPQTGVALTAGAMAVLLMLAPLLPFVLHPLVAALFGPTDPTAAGLRIWSSIVADEPARLITGRGFEMAIRGRMVGLLPAEAPRAAPFEVWYELGLVGAAAGAVALSSAARAAGRAHAPIVPGAMASFASAFTFANLGIGLTQAWWLTALAVTVLVLVAAQRGQFRTSRPKAILRGRG